MLNPGKARELARTGNGVANPPKCLATRSGEVLGYVPTQHTNTRLHTRREVTSSIEKPACMKKTMAPAPGPHAQTR